MVKIKNQKCAWHFCLSERVRSQFAGCQDQRAGGKSPRPGTPGNFPWPNSSRHRQRVKFLRGGSRSKRGSLHLLHKCAIWCSLYSSLARTHTLKMRNIICGEEGSCTRSAAATLINNLVCILYEKRRFV
jgi:hypothetical protein